MVRSILQGFVRNFYTPLALDIIGYAGVPGQHGKKVKIT